MLQPNFSLETCQSHWKIIDREKVWEKGNMNILWRLRFVLTETELVASENHIVMMHVEEYAANGFI